MKVLRLTLIFLQFGLVPAAGLADGLSGTVRDSVGGLLPGTEVVLENLDTARKYQAISDSEGRFLFSGLDRGRYRLSATRSDLQSYQADLEIRGETRQDIVLEVAPLSNEVVVTGMRIPTPLNQTGRSVSVINSDQIEVRQQRFLYEALQAIPGIQFTRSGSFGALSSLSVRGLESDQTLVVQDGIVLNNPASFGNSFDFSNFDTSDVEQIEVIRGAQSTLYGSDAIGGVINIISRSGGRGFGASGFVEGGSFGTFRGAANLRGGNETVSGRATIGGVTTSGFSSADEANGNSEEDGFQSLTLSALGQYRPSRQVQLRGVVRYQNSESDFDGFDRMPIDGDLVSQSEELSLGGLLELETLGGRLTHRASLSVSRVDRQNFDRDQITFDSLGTRSSYEYQGTWRAGERASLAFGAEYDRQEARTRVGFGGNQTITTTSGYGLLQISPHQSLTLSGGIRRDSSDDFGSENSLTGAAAFQVPDTKLVFRASYSEGFRAPTAGEFGFNPDLFAEFSQGWDVGLEHAFSKDRIHLSLTYFDQQVDDLIAFDLADFTFVNIQKYDTDGVELASRFLLREDFQFDVSYTYVDAFNVSTTIAAGNQPKNRFSLEAMWRPALRLTLSGGYLFNGQEFDGATTLDSYSLLNLRAAYKLNERFDFLVRVENVTDATYQDNLGYGTAPVSAFAGIRARF